MQLKKFIYFKIYIYLRGIQIFSLIKLNKLNVFSFFILDIIQFYSLDDGKGKCN